jgi:hypothetical protein
MVSWATLGGTHETAHAFFDHGGKLVGRGDEVAKGLGEDVGGGGAGVSERQRGSDYANERSLDFRGGHVAS